MIDKPELLEPQAALDARRVSVESRRKYLTGVGVWPLPDVLNPSRWLENFKEDELEFAFRLLDKFVYFNDRMVDASFASAFHSLCNYDAMPGESYVAAEMRWQAFTRSAIVTWVTGEKPNPTDSGVLFARKARQHLGIEEEQIKEPKEALEMVVAGQTAPVIFVDDFVGSGNQFRETWNREMPIGSRKASFSSVSSMVSNKFFYCPAFACELGLRKLSIACGGVTISAGQIIPSVFGVSDPKSTIWAEGSTKTGIAFLKGVSSRAGIPPANWAGFSGLGLLMAFSHSVPDATLPIIYWEENGWKPLIPRR